MDPLTEHLRLQTRRHFFRNTGLGLGTAALASLLPDTEAAAPLASQTDGLPGLPHFAPKAKRVIYLFMAGAPAQLDMFDYKPELDGLFDKDLPDSVRMGQRLTTMTSKQKRFPLAPSIYKFKQHGQSGAWVSELLPHMASMVDDLAIIKSVHTEAINHDPAITLIQTGREIPGWPSLGAWLSYGLGSENQSLPSFMVLNSTWTGRKEAQALYNRLWGAGFLPSKHQGVLLRSTGDPVLYLSNPKGVSPSVRRRMLDSLGRLNRQHYGEFGDPETQARIAQYEMAYRMQTSVPELTDLSKEPKHIFDMYGPDSRKPGTFAYHCLLTRRMMEKGVRLVQIYHRGWDQHFNIAGDLPNQCRDIDQPATALIQDLKARGLLEDTLVVWGGEFGRTVYCQGKLTRKNYGRDHHPRCFTMWMAGAGIKGGIVHGETDDFSYNIIESPVHIRDINATLLHQMGIDHQRLSVKFMGLDVRLTGVLESNIIKAILS
ncbi:MAG: DUF1501 domain-containing protein [Planctomycetota bacterium]|jgi:hypothetical protein|nr:DUF1501 domain-containing protein [Planctomycetota bacterium]